MAKIHYALAGEGRGHATRAGTVVDGLSAAHDVTLFAPGLAHRMLEQRYAGSPVRVVRIDGPTFRYDARQRLDKLRTTVAALSYLRRLPGLVRGLEQRIRDERPDLCITDFDPALPRAAERCGVPYVSIDHQHFLVVGDFAGLPLRLRGHAWAMARLVRAYYRRQLRTIVSSFAFPPPRPGFEHVVRAGVLLRRELLGARPERGHHVCVYLRRFATPNVLRALAGCGRDVRVYGLGDRPRQGRLSFHAVDERRFVEDLATCDVLVSTAGNQLVGEALWLGKPVLAVPEDGNDEQRINAHLLAASGAGTWRPIRSLNAIDVRTFLDAAGAFRARIDRRGLCGNDVVLDTIHDLLGSTAPRETPALEFAAS